MILEILDRGGEVRARYRFGPGPLTIGRAYDNDVILEDSYVAAHHARFELTESGWTAVDLGSGNGLYVAGQRDRVQRVQLKDDLQLRMGHTQLRVRGPDHPVAPELIARRPHRLRGALVFAAVLLGSAAVLLMSTYSSIRREMEWLSLLGSLLLPAFMLVVWIGGWAFASRIFTGRINILRHATIALLGVAAAVVLNELSGYVLFALSLPGSDSVASLENATILAVVLYRHLRLVSRIAPRGLAMTATALSACLFGGIWFAGIASRPEYSGKLRYVYELKAPYFRLAPARSVEDFFSHADDMRRELDALRRKD